MRKEILEKINKAVEEFKTVKYEKVTGNKFLSIERYKCQLNNGQVIYREKLLKNNKSGNAAIILPITKNNTTIITVQPRTFTKTTVGIALPAGYVEDNESYEEAARRELLEETGYKAGRLIEICDYNQEEGCSSSLNKGFIAEGCEKVSDQSLDESEYIKYFECTIDELLYLLDNGYIKGINSQFTIEKAKEFLKKRG